MIINKKYKDYVIASKKFNSKLPRTDNMLCKKCSHTRILHLMNPKWTSCTVGTCNCLKFK